MSDCTNFGPLGFGSSTDKCVIRTGFSIQSDPENSQLGALLAFGSGGGFFACGTTLDVRGNFYQFVLSHVLILFNFYRFGSSRVHPMQAVLLSTCSLYPFYPFNFLRGIYNVVEFFT